MFPKAYVWGTDCTTADGAKNMRTEAEQQSDDHPIDQFSRFDLIIIFRMHNKNSWLLIPLVLPQYPFFFFYICS
jgi:hypothetical protein